MNRNKIIEILEIFRFQFNDNIVRKCIVNSLCEYKVICSPWNNTPEMIDNNCLNVDVYDDLNKYYVRFEISPSGIGVVKPI